MSKFIKSRTQKRGLEPGEVVYVGEKKATKPTIEIVDYGPDHIEELRVEAVERCFDYRDKASVTWININGLTDTELIRQLGKHYGIQDMVLEDIVDTGQRPKIEDQGNFIYVVMKMLYLHPEDGSLEVEQVSLVLGAGYVITFQEHEGDVLAPIRSRIREGKLRVRTFGADYLAYALIDTIVDHYFVVLENIGERLERLDDEVINDPTPETLQAIYRSKRVLIFLRKAVWPMRELANHFKKIQSPLITEPIRVFVADVYDHTLQVIDTTDSFRDLISGLQDVYLSNLSNKMNEVIKTLTIIATIFIPLTFIVGIYGMNFTNMPELTSPHGYKVVWVAIGAVAITMLIFFRRRKWL